MAKKDCNKILLNKGGIEDEVEKQLNYYLCRKYAKEKETPSKFSKEWIKKEVSRVHALNLQLYAKDLYDGTADVNKFMNQITSTVVYNGKKSVDSMYLENIWKSENNNALQRPPIEGVAIAENAPTTVMPRFEQNALRVRTEINYWRDNI